MKTLLTILATTLFSLATAQCETNIYTNSYWSIPGFFNLYFTGQCLSEPISDTTICVRVPRTNQSQVVAFSYSSPNGAPAFVTEIRQYADGCNLIEYGTLIESGTDTITVCYDIQTELIDNFCPYTILSGGLAVEWCGIYAYFSDNQVHIRFMTCSNSGTLRYDIIRSNDAINWTKVGGLLPRVQTSSTLAEYNSHIPFNVGGDNYFAIREYDVNGGVSVSDIVYVNIPYPVSGENAKFDILGRIGASNSYMYYVQPK